MKVAATDLAYIGMGKSDGVRARADQAVRNDLCKRRPDRSYSRTNNTFSAHPQLFGARHKGNTPSEIHADARSDDVAPVFTIGYGRSGTTLLGGRFAVHPKVNYICLVNANLAKTFINGYRRRGPGR